MSLLVAILACVPHAPPEPYFPPAPPLVELPRVESFERLDGECVRQGVVPGETLNCTGVVLPAGEALELAEKADQLESSELLRDAQQRQEEALRREANDAIRARDEALREANKNTRRERNRGTATAVVTVVLGFLLGVVVGG